MYDIREAQPSMPTVLSREVQQICRVRLVESQYSLNASTDLLVQRAEGDQGPVRELKLVYQRHIYTPFQGRLLNVIRAGEGLNARQGNIQLLPRHVQYGFT